MQIARFGNTILLHIAYSDPQFTHSRVTIRAQLTRKSRVEDLVDRGVYTREIFMFLKRKQYALICIDLRDFKKGRGKRLLTATCKITISFIYSVFFFFFLIIIIFFFCPRVEQKSDGNILFENNSKRRARPLPAGGAYPHPCTQISQRGLMDELLNVIGCCAVHRATTSTPFPPQ